MSCHSGRQSISQEGGTQFSKMQQTAAKWIWSTHHFSKSCPQYLWVCQVTQAAMEPVAAPAAVQMVGELPTMWQGGQQDTQLTPSWSVLHTSGNKMLTWAYPEHANNIWVWTRRTRVSWGRSSTSTEHRVLRVWWASTHFLPLTTWFSRNLTFI